MKQRTIATLLILLALLPLSAAAQTVAERRLNVLLILTDDQGWGDLRVNGNEKIDTPALDKLAAEGASFERFFVSPLCAPTRASLLTGRYSQRTGALWVTRGLETMRAEEVTIAEALRQAGYATGIFGKWHNGAHYPHDPRGQGFDEFFGFCGGHWTNYFDTTLEHNGQTAQTKGYITDALTDAAISFIERNRRCPFFAYVQYNAPHKPLQVPDRYFDKYKRRGLDDQLAGIYGMVENIDDNVGRLLRKLDELKLADNTIVVYPHDNGPNGERYNGGMKGRKGSVHEGGVRSPLFVRWPGKLKPGLNVPQIAAHIDLFPTLLDLCGAPAPKNLRLDGLSLAPLLRGEAGEWPDRTLFTYHFPNPDSAQVGPGAARTQRYRLVKTNKGAELYDLIADPNQQRDIAAAEPQIVARLSAAYEAWLKDVMKDGVAPPPIPVGHPQAPEVELPAPETAVRTGVAFKGANGWAHDWLVGWDDVNDRMVWELDVAQAGKYAVALLYTCSQSDIGSRVRVEVGGQSIEGIIKRAHDPPPLPSPDREPRPEVYEKIWATVALGDISLTAGRARLTVSAVSVAGKTVAELKAVRLRRIK